MPTTSHIHLLIVDFHDSYTYNIPAFIQDAAKIVSCHVKLTVKPYTSLAPEDVPAIAGTYHGVVLSAGPGSVRSAADLGNFTPALISYRPAVPVYGICFGFQAICATFGADIHQLSVPHHGIVSEILDLEHRSLGRRATRYHSLEVLLNENAAKMLKLEAIARNVDESNSCSVMEVSHRALPFWGVQYHPESVYSQNCQVTALPFIRAAVSRIQLFGDISQVSTPCDTNYIKTDVFQEQSSPPKSSPFSHTETRILLWNRYEGPRDFLRFCRNINTHKHDFIFLDSADKDEWSIFTQGSTAFVFQYSLKTKCYSFKPVTERSSQNEFDADLFDSRLGSLEDVWLWLKSMSSKVRYKNGPPQVPFWGGFIGYFSYEVGLAQLGLDPYPYQSTSTPDCDDIHLFWSTETIAYHKSSRKVYAMSLTSNVQWMSSVKRFLHIFQDEPECTSIPKCYNVHNQIRHPDRESYLARIADAQEHIHAGNSYELCLTASTTVDCPYKAPHSNLDSKNNDDFSELFHSLRCVSPAAFSSFMQLRGTTVLSASPEEFLVYQTGARVVRMRPIKGTIAKITPAGRRISYKEAEQILSAPHFIAENLMIVDLIRSDLSKVALQVRCPRLMWVEEIETIYQLVSTVEGTLTPVDSSNDTSNTSSKFIDHDRDDYKVDTTAWDLLRATLPPGSMTGAPKRRSCQILQQLEHDAGSSYRGIYSGVIGYIDVRGECATSVAIRNAIKYKGQDVWTVGAGGALTALSEAEAEWKERCLKATSVLNLYTPKWEILETMRWDPINRTVVDWLLHFYRLRDTLERFGFAKVFGQKRLDPQAEEVEQKPNAIGLFRGTSNILNSDCNENGFDESFDNVFSSNDATSECTTGPDSNETLLRWIYAYIPLSQRSFDLRLSLTVDANGTPALRTTKLDVPFNMSRNPWIVKLDPVAIHVELLEPFVSNKTSVREHYEAARVRAKLGLCEEVALFRPPNFDASWQNLDAKACIYDQREQTYKPGGPNDLLTEGSFTNIAVWDTKSMTWITPLVGCLPGIERGKLIRAGEIKFGEVRRHQLKRGVLLKLFNSVRGSFDAVVG